ncbi:universal stress protein [Thermodesulfobacteriota bacterium B35]
MHRFKKILLVYDPSPSGVTSLAKAVDLVERNEAELTVVAVIDEIPRDYRMLLTAMTPEEIMSLARKDTLSRLEEYIAPFSETGRVTTRVLVGQESIAIIREVLRNGHDLVMKTARGMGGKLGMLFGSTAMHLLRKCPCPVWILKPEENRRFYRRIMAALDILPAEAEESGLNKKIMELTISMAEIEGSEIHIVHVAENPDDHLLLGALDIPPEEIGRWSRETRNMRIGKLDEFLEEFDLADLQHQEHVLQGWADEEIPQFANEYKIDLLVMGTLARTGIPGLFIGNTAEKILHRVNCSVLAVKPDGFISPVTLDED